MLKFLAKIFGTKSEKDIKRIMPLVELTKQEYAKLASISNDELRTKTIEVQAFIAEQLKPIDGQLAQLHGRVDNEPDLDINEKESIFNQIDKLELERNAELEKVLVLALPKAFAIMRETAKRFKENETIEVTAQEFDRVLAAKAEHVKIVGDKAQWKNEWMAAGNLSQKVDPSRSLTTTIARLCEHLPAPPFGLPNVVLDDRVAAGETMLYP